MSEIAVCVPTYGHPEVVEDVLTNSIETYSKLGIDVYYYDSSVDNRTFAVIEKFWQQGYENLYYIKLSSDLGIDVKVEMIFEGYGLEKKYDYIWPIKDRAYCPEKTLREIIKAVDEAYDIIFLGVISDRTHSELCTKTYVDAKEFYGDWAWLATSLDVIIYKHSSMLAEFKMQEFNEQCKFDYNIYWCPYVLVFRKLAQEKDLRVRLLCDENTILCNSPLGQSSWKKDIFKIWKDYWIKVNEDLPECYDEYKDVIIKDTASLPWILGSTLRLIELQEAGILTPENYNEVIRDWERISDIPVETVREIAYGTYDYFHDVAAIKNVKSEISLLLIQLIKMLKNEKIRKEQIPFDDIIDCMYGEFVGKNRYSEELLNSMLGSVADVEQFVMKEDTSLEDAAKAMQILVNFLLLMN